MCLSFIFIKTYFGAYCQKQEYFTYYVYWIISIHTMLQMWGHDSTGYLPVFRFPLFVSPKRVGPGLSSQGVLVRLIPGMHGIHQPD